MDTQVNVSLSEALATDIDLRRRASLKAKINAYPRKNPIMSDISECSRQMVYGITDWDKKPLHDEDLQARFDVGNLQEREIIRELQGLGYDFSLSQMPVEIKHKDGSILATGKVDGFIRFHGVKIPVEIKSSHPNVFNQIDSIEDLQKKPYLRKYTRQLMLYMYGNNCEEGIFIFTDCLGAIKILPIHLDYGECEAILKRLEQIHDHLIAKTLPERIEFREDICGKCPFASICLPDFLRKELNVLTDTDLLFYLQEREMAKSAKSIYESADGWVKKFLKKYNIEKGIAGDFAIMGKLMPAKKPSEKEPQPYMMYSIKKVSEIEKPQAETYEK